MSHKLTALITNQERVKVLILSSVYGLNAYGRTVDPTFSFMPYQGSIGTIILFPYVIESSNVTTSFPFL